MNNKDVSLGQRKILVVAIFSLSLTVLPVRPGPGHSLARPPSLVVGRRRWLWDRSLVVVSRRRTAHPFNIATPFAFGHDKL